MPLNSYSLPRLPESQPRSADTSARGQPIVLSTADHVRASGEAHGAIDQDDITVTLIADEGYHVNATPASLDYLIPTRLVVARLPNLRVPYPDATVIKPKFAPDGLEVYQGRVILRVAAPKGSVAPGKPMVCSLTVQACNGESCLPPATLPVTIEFAQ